MKMHNPNSHVVLMQIETEDSDNIYKLVLDIRKVVFLHLDLQKRYNFILCPNIISLHNIWLS